MSDSDKLMAWGESAPNDYGFMRRGDSEPARVATRNLLARARGRNGRKPPGTRSVHVTPALAAQVQVSRVEQSRSGWRPTLEFKPDAPRNVSSQVVVLRDIVLPKGKGTQVANCGQLS